MLKKLLTCLFIFLFFSMVPKAYAASEFATSYDVTYDVAEEGVTTVTEKVILRNLTSRYYATQFKLTVNATQITDVAASDPSGPIEASLEQKDSTTTITVKFNQQVAGLDKELPWTLKFKSKDFAQRQGKIWEVTVPKVVSSTSLEKYNLTLSVPISFGEPTLITPQPNNQKISFNKLFLTYDKEQLTQSGISASFGSIQLFDFDLSYHLENSNLVPILTNISLPPDTAYQDLIFQRMEPKPINVTVDDDGNYLAWYRLERSQKLDVKVNGSAKLYSKSKAKVTPLSKDLFNKLTKTDKYWEKDNPAIKNKLSDILGANPPAGSYEKAKLIHRFVVTSLRYNTQRITKGNIERFGAVTALNNPNTAVCMEFTDLFIALARAAGIPARELDGYAYTGNNTLRPLSLTKDILHAWPEFWDENLGWVMIDPTWENTTGGVDYFNKLDLNHFVFATKGISSEQPIPAGSYKFIDRDSDDVKVKLSDVDFLGKPQIDVLFGSSEIVSGVQAKIKVKVVNLGNALNPSTDIKVSSPKLKVLSSTSQNLGPVPAFGYAQFEYTVRTNSIWDDFEDNFEVKIGDHNFSKKILARPFFYSKTFTIMVIGLSMLIVTVYLAVLGGFIYRKRLLKREV